MTPFQKSALTIAIDWLTTEPTNLSAWVAQGRLVRVMLEAALAEEKEPKSAPMIARITCGFSDVRFGDEGWRCSMCNEKMPSNYEELVKHDSGERDYLELMQRKAEAIRARGSNGTTA